MPETENPKPRLLLSKPAENKIPHWQIWNELLEEASSNGGGAYDHPPEEGAGHSDKTAFVPAQKSWGGDRGQWPEVLLRWLQPRQTQEYKVGVLNFDNQTVVDWEGHPVKAFPNLPLTISSKVENWRLEAWWRQDGRLTVTDFLARMPSVVTPEGRKPAASFDALKKRMGRFRDKSGLTSWPVRTDTMPKFRYLENLRLAELTPAQIEGNLALGRDLTDAEYRHVQELSMRPESPLVGSSSNEQPPGSAPVQPPSDPPGFTVGILDFGDNQTQPQQSNMDRFLGARYHPDYYNLVQRPAQPPSADQVRIDALLSQDEYKDLEQDD